MKTTTDFWIRFAFKDGWQRYGMQREKERRANLQSEPSAKPPKPASKSSRH
jgi:hypothetical protein